KPDQGAWGASMKAPAVGGWSKKPQLKTGPGGPRVWSQKRIKGGMMHAIQRVRSALFLFAALTALAVPAVAAGDHGGDGGGGGGGTPPPSTAAPAVTFTPTS